MKSTMSPIETLDSFLNNFLEKKHENYQMSIADFSDLVRKVNNYDLTLAEIEMILRKLIKDGYVVYDESKSFTDFIQKVTTRNYQLTFEGKLFIEQGGYITSFKSAQNESRIKNVKENLLIVGTWLAGIGALALVVWEIYEKFCLRS